MSIYSLLFYPKGTKHSPTLLGVHVMVWAGVGRDDNDNLVQGSLSVTPNERELDDCSPVLLVLATNGFPSTGSIPLPGSLVFSSVELDPEPASLPQKGGKTG